MKNKTPFSRTDLSKKCKYHRVMHRIEGRLNYFEDQINFRYNHPDYAEYYEKLNEFKAQATKHILNLQSAVNYYNYNKTVGKGGDQTLRQRAKRADDIARKYRNAYDWQKEWKTREEHLEEYFHITLPESYWKEKPLRWLTDKLGDSSLFVTTNTMKSRLALEIEDARKKDWFIIFGTLTIDNQYKDLVFEKGARAWPNFQRQIKRMVQTKCYGSTRKAIDKPECYHSLAVVEEGIEGQLHLHCLLFMKELPDIADPNYGMVVPFLREITDFEIFWEYGYSQFIPVRFSQGDAYGQLGWSWPVIKGHEIEPTDTATIVNYLIKYIQKSTLNERNIPWRTKASRQVGKDSLTRKLSTMKTSQVYSLALMTTYPKPIKLVGMNSPTRFIRDASVSELIIRYKKSRKAVKALEPDTRLRTLLKSGTLKRHNHKSQNTGNILAQILTGRDVSSRYMNDNWEEARKELEREFPPTIAMGVSGGILTGL